MALFLTIVATRNIVVRELKHLGAPALGEIGEMYTGYWIQGDWIWGPRDGGKYWIQDRWIWGPRNGGKYWIENGWIWGPTDGGKFWIDGQYIYGPSKYLPFMSA